jgi:hypothetical protein
MCPRQYENFKDQHILKIHVSTTLFVTRPMIPHSYPTTDLENGVCTGGAGGGSGAIDDTMTNSASLVGEGIAKTNGFWAVWKILCERG